VFTFLNKLLVLKRSNAQFKPKKSSNWKQIDSFCIIFTYFFKDFESHRHWIQVKKTTFVGVYFANY